MAILDGRKIAEKILDELKGEIKKIPASPAGGPLIKLAVILVGNNPASLNFIKQKQKVAERLGINFKLFNFSDSITEKKLADELKKIVKDKSIYGVVVQLPLPKKITEQKILNIIPSEKDVDALSVDNSLVNPPTASAIMEILNFYHLRVKGKKVVIIGKGKLVGKPLAVMIKKQGADLCVCDKKTKDLAQKTLRADILISATGSPHLIKENMVKKGAVVIDAGFFKSKDGKIKGDVDFEKVNISAAYITPVPGGVGPMTVAMLFSNLTKLAKIKK